MTIQLVGGPMDGVEVPDNGQQVWLTPVPVDSPLLESTLGVTDVAPSWVEGRYERYTYVSPDRAPRSVMLWRGIS